MTLSNSEAAEKVGDVDFVVRVEVGKRSQMYLLGRCLVEYAICAHFP
jgi:hypothetical protein